MLRLKALVPLLAIILGLLIPRPAAAQFQYDAGGNAKMTVCNAAGVCVSFDATSGGLKVFDAGTSGTGITICAGAVGSIGWLSCIYNVLSGLGFVNTNQLKVTLYGPSGTALSIDANGRIAGKVCDSGTSTQCVAIDANGLLASKICDAATGPSKCATVNGSGEILSLEHNSSSIATNTSTTATNTGTTATNTGTTATNTGTVAGAVSSSKMQSQLVDGVGGTNKQAVNSSNEALNLEHNSSSIATNTSTTATNTGTTATNTSTIAGAVSSSKMQGQLVDGVSGTNKQGVNSNNEAYTQPRSAGNAQTIGSGGSANMAACTSGSSSNCVQPTPAPGQSGYSPASYALPTNAQMLCYYSTGAVSPSSGFVVPVQCDVNGNIKFTGTIIAKQGGSNGTNNLLTASSATACTNLVAAATTLGSITNSGGSMTVFIQFYNDASNTCASGTNIWGDGTTVALGPGQTVNLNIPLSAGLAYKITGGALGSNLDVVTF